MKKLIILTILSLSTLTFAQDENGSSFFSSNVNNVESPGTGGGDTDLEDQDPAPIDDYAPLLILGALGLAFLASKKLNKQVK